MIEVHSLTKRYGRTVAVDDLSFSVRPGRVTGFLGPNGAGKSTTMRMILGLDSPDTGHALVNGRPYDELRAPLREMGSLLDASAVHPGRTAYHHLLGMAQSNGLSRSRVDEVLDQTGLSRVGHRRVGGFSLGMRQRLGIAAALLGDPGIVMFDEPMNGLDTEGIRWIRDLMRHLAEEGRSVFLSSHVMSEMELAADHLVVIGQGLLIADTTMRSFIDDNSRPVTTVRSPRCSDLMARLEATGAQAQADDDSSCRVVGANPSAIGDLALQHGIALHELTPCNPSLEDVYMQMTQASVEFHTTTSNNHKEVAHQ